VTTVTFGLRYRKDGHSAPAREDAAGGWGGFVADFEAGGELRASPPRLG
jgi:hypothetical protein